MGSDYAAMTDLAAQDDHGFAPAVPIGERPRVLFVDFDGTLLRTDLLHEMLLALFKSHVWLLLRAFLRLTRGIAAFKRAVSEAIIPEIRRLPFRSEVLNFIIEQRSLGRKIILATATDSVWAQRVADELGIFDNILASDGVHNLKGKAKLAAIHEYCREHGYKDFDYLGDTNADIPIWREAQGVFLVAPSIGLVRRVRQFTDTAVILGKYNSRKRSLILALRPQQWVKNFLVFVPLVASHRVFDLRLVLDALIAFACFCLCASTVYILNDLLDIDADRSHPTKRKRPFASGDLSISRGLAFAALVFFGAFAISWLTMPDVFSAALGVYFAASCCYSFFAKRLVMIDVIVLAGLYALRVFAGGTATGIAVSEWLIAFSIFFFVSLALLKRYAELKMLSRTDKAATMGRGYNVRDIAVIRNIGTANGYIAVLVLALYINGEQVKLLYHDPWPLWLVCPVLMYWISRLWIKANRSEMSEDPLIFALRDRVSLILGIITAGLMLIAKYF